MKSNKDRIEKLIDSVRAIALTGSHYARSPYDKKHYEDLLELTSKEYSIWTGSSQEVIKKKLKEDIGYVTTKVGTNGIVFNEQNELLLEHRVDDDSWGLPGGWVDVQDTPEQSCIRELKEETGLDVKIKKLIGISSREAGEFGISHSSCHILYECKVIGGVLQKSFESQEVRFWKVRDVPKWHRDHLLWLKNHLDL